MLLGNTVSRNSLPISHQTAGCRLWLHFLVRCRWRYVASRCWTESTLHVSINHLRLLGCGVVAPSAPFFRVLFLWWPFVCLILSPNKHISCQRTASLVFKVQDGVNKLNLSLWILCTQTPVFWAFSSVSFVALMFTHAHQHTLPQVICFFSLFWLWTHMAN